MIDIICKYLKDMTHVSLVFILYSRITNSTYFAGTLPVLKLASDPNYIIFGHI